MIKPLLNMTIKGAIWYQGESNQGDPLSFQDPQGLPMAQYGCHFPSMIADCESVVPWCAREGKHAVYVRPPLTQLNDGGGGGGGGGESGKVAYASEHSAANHHTV